MAGADADYSDGDTLTLSFDRLTDTPPAASREEVQPCITVPYSTG